MFCVKGVIPAVVTSFRSDESLDENAVRRTVRFLVDSGVHGLYLTGSTGEMFLMDEHERNRVLELAVEEAGGRVPVIAHIGNIGTQKSIALSKAAARIGVDAVSSIAPMYWNFTEEDIYAYYSDLAAATDKPLIVYNIALAKLLNSTLIDRLAKIPNVCGVKYTATTHFEIGRMKRALGQDFLVYSGCDEMAVSGLLNGADGIIGSFYNLMPDVFLRLYAACQRGDYETAAAEQQRANQVILTALQYDYLAVIKLCMKWMGLDAGRSRRPFHCYTAEEEAHIRAEFRTLRDTRGLTDIGFLQYV